MRDSGYWIVLSVGWDIKRPKGRRWDALVVSVEPTDELGEPDPEALARDAPGGSLPGESGHHGQGGHSSGTAVRSGCGSASPRSASASRGRSRPPVSSGSRRPCAWPWG
jgi:hypothetical protein